MGHLVEQQREFPVQYRGQLIGMLIPDLIVDEKVIADPKVVTAFNATHLAQMLGYLNVTGLEVALLLNFSEVTLHWKRIVNDSKSPSALSCDIQVRSDSEPRMGTDGHG
jgi:GxxExxY protein